MGSALNLLLDSSTFIWAASYPERLTDRARSVIENDDTDVHVSAASTWEIATKHRLGRLHQAAPLVAQWDAQLHRLGYIALDVTHPHALRAGGYDVGHSDPFDRVLAAQAELEGMTLVSPDRAFDLFPVVRLW